ncbi:hypothetical protein [Staphylococcus caledonicus]|uniref:hypothetical protein n=1 Tax=Staphylococcus caledonicus TaxID=2741333 RepID=UPI0018E443D2|nr:hypothetical protein [Staphylococcus caledonicus]MBI5972004.1 hypothetical protein [Staphylococcus caledonicus]MBI5972188.1 hypothetical protein [Staphylococcus caledonicus]
MRHKLLKIANELNELILNSDVNAYVEFRKYKDGDIGVDFTHIHQSYKYDNESITIYSFNDESTMLNKFELAKKVINGECLINV